MILFLFIVLSISDETILQIFGGFMFIGVPLLDYLPDIFGHNRFKYYIGGYDVTSITILMTMCNLIVSFTVFILHVSKIYSNVYILFWQSIFLFIITSILAVLVNIGAFERYVCDMNSCTNFLRNRVIAYNCFFTGRVVCKKCKKKYCMHCNFYQGTYSTHYVPPCVKQN